MSTPNNLREKYRLRPHVVAQNDPAREAQWNELARIFVQRFQQLHGLPMDSLAGPQSFKLLDTLVKP